MSKIWVLGEALIDFVPVASDDAATFASYCGGSPFNAAKAAAQAGADVGFLGAVSSDMFGDRLTADLQAHGVDMAHTPRSSAPSTLAFVELHDGQARYAFFNALSAVSQMAPDVGAFPGQDGDILALGSIALIDQPGADNIAAYAAALSDRVCIALDPNARPQVTPSADAWRARITGLADIAGVLKLSDEDLEFLAPGMSSADFAEAQFARGTGLIVVTHGAEGAEAFTPAGRVFRKAPKIELADTVGAGDTTTGYLLAELATRGVTAKSDLRDLSKDVLSETLEKAMAAAAINCTRFGCMPPTADEVTAFRARTNVA